MRRLILAIALVGLLAPIARADEVDVRGSNRGDEIEYSGGSSKESAGSGGGRGSGGGSEGPRYTAEYPYLVRQGDTTCIESETREYPTEEAAQAARNESAERWGRLSRDYEQCPRDPANPRSAQAEAEAFWGTVPLPKPAPEIDPGWAVTGRRSFLETGGSSRETYTRDTPNGQLVIEATGQYYVDWGDGTQSGPFDAPGQPWPNGQITHTYERVGQYDVVVTQRWTARWRMNGESGRLGGLRTEGRIDNFRVEQLQAVRNR